MGASAHDRPKKPYVQLCEYPEGIHKGDYWPLQRKKAFPGRKAARVKEPSVIGKTGGVVSQSSEEERQFNVGWKKKEIVPQKQEST